MLFNRKKFSVRIKGKTGLVYTEGERRLTIDSELFVDPAGISIFPNSIKRWDPPFDKEPLSADEKNRILKNLTSDMQKRGLMVDMG